MGRAVFALHCGSEVTVAFIGDRQYSHYIIAVNSVLGFCGMGWDGMGRAVFALHYNSEVSVGFLWDGMGWAVFALHYNSEVSVGVLWDGMGSIRITL